MAEVALWITAFKPCEDEIKQLIKEHDSTGGEYSYEYKETDDSIECSFITKTSSNAHLVMFPLRDKIVEKAEGLVEVHESIEISGVLTLYQEGEITDKVHYFGIPDVEQEPREAFEYIKRRKNEILKGMRK